MTTHEARSDIHSNGVALVTGSSSGIGYATSLLLARNRFHTYATMRDLNKSASLRELAEKEDLSLHIEKLDVGDEISVRRTVQKIVSQEKGKIDVLINNAGYSLIGCLEDLSLTEIKAQFETNVFGVIRMTQAVLPIMRKNRHGYIINVSSISGLLGWPAGSAYVSSKFSLEGLSESMAYELQQFGIKVILIEPTAVRSNIQNSTVVAKKAKQRNSPYSRLTQHVLDRMAFLQKNAIPPEKVAKVIFDAISSKDLKLRHLVGRDAITIMKKRTQDATDLFIDKRKTFA